MPRPLVAMPRYIQLPTIIDWARFEPVNKAKLGDDHDDVGKKAQEEGAVYSVLRSL
jgi:hypothetical protein